MFSHGEREGKRYAKKRISNIEQEMSNDEGVKSEPQNNEQEMSNDEVKIVELG